MKQNIIAFFTILLFIVLTGMYVFSIKYRSRDHTIGLIANDVKRLTIIFKRIDDQCRILSFDFQKNPINFLNVKTFEGSEVGPMNLAYPDKWEGPYLDNNPTMQSKEYQIVRTKQGHFITPGDGVRLPNGKVVGTDIVLDEDADILHMMHDKNALRVRGVALAAPLPLGNTKKLRALTSPLFRQVDH